MTHCCEAPRSILFNYFGKMQVLRDNFGEIWRQKIQMYPETSVEPKSGEFYLKNEVYGCIVTLVTNIFDSSCTDLTCPTSILLQDDL